MLHLQPFLSSVEWNFQEDWNQPSCTLSLGREISFVYIISGESKWLFQSKPGFLLSGVERDTGKKWQISLFLNTIKMQFSKIKEPAIQKTLMLGWSLASECSADSCNRKKLPSQTRHTVHHIKWHASANMLARNLYFHPATSKLSSVKPRNGQEKRKIMKLVFF